MLCRRLVDRYLEALVRHDTSGLALGSATSNLQGQITAVEAMGAQLPYGALSGWHEQAGVP